MLSRKALIIGTPDVNPCNTDVSNTSMRLWLTPTVGHVDLNDARNIISAAKKAILFVQR
jgi:hypothetical protein